MYVQIKSKIGPPELKEGDTPLFVSKEGLHITKRKGLWVYKPQEDDELSLTIPQWLRDHPMTVCAHDTEGWDWQTKAARVLSSRSGRALCPYAMSTKNEPLEFDAAFSINIPYARIEFNANLFTLRVEEIDCGVIFDANLGAPVARIDKTVVFDEPVRVEKIFCKICGEVTGPEGRHDHPFPDHNVVFSNFADIEHLNNYDKAIRAAYKKAVYRIKRACFINKSHLYPIEHLIKKAPINRA